MQGIISKHADIYVGADLQILIIIVYIRREKRIPPYVYLPCYTKLFSFWGWRGE